jgi:drug/metabolite transporter (DMT)-like permease
MPALKRGVSGAWGRVMPPLGLLFGWLLLGEHVALSDLLGIVPVAIGIYLVTHSATSQRSSQQRTRPNSPRD